VPPNAAELLPVEPPAAAIAPLGAGGRLPAAEIPAALAVVAAPTPPDGGLPPEPALTPPLRASCGPPRCASGPPAAFGRACAASAPAVALSLGGAARRARSARCGALLLAPGPRLPVPAPPRPPRLPPVLQVVPPFRAVPRLPRPTRPDASRSPFCSDHLFSFLVPSSRPRLDVSRWRCLAGATPILHQMLSVAKTDSVFILLCTTRTVGGERHAPWGAGTHPLGAQGSCNAQETAIKTPHTTIKKRHTHTTKTQLNTHTIKTQHPPPLEAAALRSSPRHERWEHCRTAPT